MNAGRLFVFEGVDGAGKSSVSEGFVHALQQKGITAELLSFPGKKANTLGEMVYRLHHNSKSVGVDSVTAASLQTLHIAAHLDAIETTIIPSLESGNCIVLDRFWWSTWVYGIVGGIQKSVLSALIEVERQAWGKWQPTLLFHISRATPLRPEPIETWSRLKQAYEQLVSAEKGKYPISVISNETTREAALQQVFSQIRF